ncbi:uncharacterized protein LOC106873303 [Octopus bimaculoides]|uniref:uncharacterized protein LOC106873303 n=1 Tax=Octopus bimaculoides TaxID=37653 RepID=UPI00071C5500|nr:uncharacterized protein LOC106873303 [Octopus bimaculoides]|eukprot:XP_014776102.1 PREDICTED: uncharacterized protein LOC106873303 [Octopus bimaculoides]
MEDKNFMEATYSPLLTVCKKSTATEVMENFCEVYPDAVKSHTCQLWFKKFKDDDCDMSDKPDTGRQPTLNNDLLNETIISDSHQSTRDLVQKLNVSFFSYPQTFKANWENMQRGDLDST